MFKFSERNGTTVDNQRNADENQGAAETAVVESTADLPEDLGFSPQHLYQKAHSHLQFRINPFLPNLLLLLCFVVAIETLRKTPCYKAKPCLKRPKVWGWGAGQMPKSWLSNSTAT